MMIFWQSHVILASLFFFQAEDGIRDIGVTGVQTCALPILINCMAKSLSDIGADKIIISSIKKFMVSKNTAFIVLGITNVIMSWLFWPTPAVMLIGAIMVPVAIEVGLPKIRSEEHTSELQSRQ